MSGASSGIVISTSPGYQKFAYCFNITSDGKPGISDHYIKDDTGKWIEFDNSRLCAQIGSKLMLSDFSAGLYGFFGGISGVLSGCGEMAESRYRFISLDRGRFHFSQLAFHGVQLAVERETMGDADN